MRPLAVVSHLPLSPEDVALVMPHEPDQGFSAPGISPSAPSLHRGSPGDTTGCVTQPLSPPPSTHRPQSQSQPPKLPPAAAPMAQPCPGCPVGTGTGIPWGGLWRVRGLLESPQPLQGHPSGSRGRGGPSGVRHGLVSQLPMARAPPAATTHTRGVFAVPRCRVCISCSSPAEAFLLVYCSSPPVPGSRSSRGAFISWGHLAFIRTCCY